MSRAGEAQLKSGVVPARVPFLDVMRGFAILAVFLFHSVRAVYDRADLVPWSTSGWIRDLSTLSGFEFLLVPFNFGSCGVAIFFVISGFCIHLSYVKTVDQDRWFRGFMTRRVLRIYPPYLVALLLFSFVWPWRSIDFSRPGDTWNFLSHLLLLHNFGQKAIFTGINGSFWSIAVEFQLYLLYPVIFWLGSKRGWRHALWWCVVVEVSLRALVSLMITWLVAANAEFEALRGLAYAPFSFMLSWGIGAAIAEAHRRGEPLPLARHSWLAWAGIAVLSTFVRPVENFSFLFYSLSTAAFLSRSLLGERLIPQFVGSGLVTRHLRFVGVTSYSLYLLHQPLLETVKPAVRRLAPTWEVPIGITWCACLATWPAILACAWILYRFCEVPAQSWGRRLATKPMRKSA